MPFRIEIKGVNKFSSKAQALYKAKLNLRERLNQMCTIWGLETVKHIQTDYMSGPRPKKLGVGTGALRRETRSRIYQSGDKLSIRFGNPLPYAAIHEYGGRTKAHIIRPRRKSFLAFQEDGKWIYSSKPIFHPGSIIPSRPYMRPGIADKMPDLKSKLVTMLGSIAKGGL